MARPADIVGYTYSADNYCPGCILRQLGWQFKPASAEAAEKYLDAQAEVLGIDRQREDTFDSGEFPKVLFRDMLRSDWEERDGTFFEVHGDCLVGPVPDPRDRCGSCGEVLGE